RNFRVDYAVQNGLFKGVGLSWLNAALRGNDSRDLDENRLVISYTLPLL
ncbi:OprD family outer membrane porin, partial [Azotobacter vinelandii]